MGAFKACPQEAAADTRGSRTCVCPSTHEWRVAHTGRRGKGELTSCRGVLSTSRESQGGRAGLPAKGKWPPRGTEMTVLTHPRNAPRVTGKAGESGQNSGDGAARSSWTRPSAPGSGETSKASASLLLDLRCGIQGNLAPGSL